MSLYFVPTSSTIYLFTLKYTDIDECISGSDNCTELTSCVNIDGSFYCACNTGYSGDGVMCFSKFISVSFSAI